MLTENLLFFPLETYYLAQNYHYFDCVYFKCQRFQNLLKQIEKKKRSSLLRIQNIINYKFSIENLAQK